MNKQYEITLDSDGLTSVQEINLFKDNEQTSELNRRTVDDIYEEHYSLTVDEDGFTPGYIPQETRGVFIADYRVDDNSYEVTELFGDMDEYEDAELLAMIDRNNKTTPDFTKSWRA